MVSDKKKKRRASSFKMFKSLETKEEFQKVKMAGFLRDLHKLARDEAKAKVKKGVQRKLTRTNTGDSPNVLTFRDVGKDLTIITPEKALQKITRLHAGFKLSSKSLLQLTEAAIKVLSEEESLIDICDNVPNLTKLTVVGDLHGSLECLMKVLEIINFTEINLDTQAIGKFFEKKKERKT